MAKNKLTQEQREALLEWLAADYDWRLIRAWFEEREWTPISRALASYYRKAYQIDIDRLRSERLDSALTKGLALKEERIARLAAHADELEKIKWEPDKNGRLWNEAAWRETLADIAAEMGHRKQAVELNWQDEARRDGFNPDEVKETLRQQFAAMVLQGRSRSLAGDSRVAKEETREEQRDSESHAMDDS